MVLSGLVPGHGKSLAIVFRGTDQYADFATFHNFASYYDLYKPLIDGIRNYLQENRVDSILVAGHSLGAGALQHFLNEDFLRSNPKVKGWTFGSPGARYRAIRISTTSFIPRTKLLSFPSSTTAYKWPPSLAP